MPRTKGSTLQRNFVIPKPDQTGPTIDKTKPARLRKKLDFHDNAASFAPLNSAKGVQARLARGQRPDRGRRREERRDPFRQREHHPGRQAGGVHRRGPRRPSATRRPRLCSASETVQFQSGHDLETILHRRSASGTWAVRRGGAMTAGPTRPPASAVPTRPIPITSSSISRPGGTASVVITRALRDQDRHQRPSGDGRALLICPGAPGTLSPRM